MTEWTGTGIGCRRWQGSRSSSGWRLAASG